MSHPDREHLRRSYRPRLWSLCLFLFIGWGILTNISYASTPNAATAPSPSASVPLSPTEAQKLLDTLNNPQERDRFTQTLSLIARSATNAPQPQPGPSTPNQAILPDFHSGVSLLRLQAEQGLNDFLNLFEDFRYISSEVQSQLTSPQKRHSILITLAKVVGVLLISLILERVISLGLNPTVQRLLRRAQSIDKRPLPSSTPESPSAVTGKAENTEALRAADQRRQAETVRFLTRIPYNIGFLFLKLVAVGTFYIVALIAYWLLPWGDLDATVLSIVGYAYVITRCLYLFVEAILAPHTSAMRLFPASDSTALLLVRWWKYLISLPAIIFVISNLGDAHFILLPRGAEALVRALVLIEHILIAIFIWRVRTLVSNFLTPPQDSKNLHLSNFLATVIHLWWIPALFLDISLWIVWAMHRPGGYRWILLTTTYTIGAIAGFRVVAILAYGLQNSLFRIRPSMLERFPNLQERADRYYPLARRILTGILITLTGITLLEIWGLPSYEFFLENPLGNRIFVTGILLLAAISVGVLIWEGVNIFLAQQLSYFDKNGFTSRATRLRTVLPIIRTVMLTLIIIIVTVTTLSQMGINVAPLLTGAGILGAAIAFGSQSLVKDFITGFFMLVEDAIQVGDWVSAGGASGTVENLSIRTVRIRDTYGDLHIIPFSAVTSITNTARGYNKIIIKHQLDLSEDFSRVTAIMSEVVAEMREDEVFGPMIQSDFLDLGVDESSASGAILVGSIQTAPMMKWKVKREFNRRVANRFARAKVNFYTGTSYITTPPDTPFHVANDVEKPSTPPQP
ncbi:mechanosensitive ion channel [Saccharibacter sp. 17.LH.SD]|uniref:mechanosensitive ion channel family protein n=1 Tax=Saccharibacter sp. 17.LH.SD TaxID=2689393 RepID=UPI0013716696|nr:mechanosensitive ion channel domain-containing protein [Saccharibacter sp. 17.LH.SD]MXV45032.1 mechanosensitive ion channel [Saccharibacter sp. 17.LH.SD]